MNNKDNFQALIAGVLSLAASSSALAEGSCTQGRPAETKAEEPVSGTKYGANHLQPASVASLSKLARHYQDQGKFEKAEDLLMRCLTFKQTEEERATTYDALASLYHDQQKLASAELWLTKALELREKAEGVDGSGVQTSLNSLAELCREKGDLELAVQLTKRAVDIARSEREKGIRTANLPNNLNNLALLYREQGDKKDTEDLFKQVVALQAKDPEANQGVYANNLNNLARFYREQGLYEAAEPLYKQSLQLREKVFGLNSPEVGATLRSYAIVLRNLNRRSEAQDLDQRANSIEAKLE